MSDKFFFKGRQDARQHHTAFGYKAKAGLRPGSEKYPLALVVTSEVRKQEVEAMAAKAQVFVDVTVDSSEGAVESIKELTAMLNKGNTVKVTAPPARNELCPCGSGKKFKKCCG
ncbi:MAG: zinc chelation protein SecC [unclassified Hahellaceae]|nr:zinc chelation protein SecC [Hahellaceae bacterium]|tara:strand:+ start:600 stop:941 length:342 start_codon:yes stop_codon:yes gene_type:complete